MKYISIILSLGLYFSAMLAANAEDAKFVRNNLNKNFAGRIFHEGDRQNGEEVLITLKSIMTDKEGNVTASGQGEFFSEKHKSRSFDFKWIIDPGTLRFVMTEKIKAGKYSMNKQGKYVGNISKNLDSIDAVWNSQDGKVEGHMTLYSIVSINH